MKAVGYRTPLPIEAPEALLDLDLPRPMATGRDLLVEVRAVSVNPVDIKVRRNAKPENGEAKVLGWDASGVVVEAGPDCHLFRPGDAVYYAGSIARQGTNAEYHLVDERIVGHKPKSLVHAQAAALPLTTLTAWELLFDRLAVPQAIKPGAGTLLIMGGAGGVGSILIQLARMLTGLTVIATASRPESRAWCLGLGAHHVIDHSQPLGEQLRAAGKPRVDLVASLTATDQHYADLVEVLAPQGKFGVIDDPKNLDATLLKRKSASLHWEYMFARSLWHTPDMEEQHRVLNRVADLVDAGVLRTTFGQDFGAITADNLRRAHRLVESGRAQGKVVLEGF